MNVWASKGQVYKEELTGQLGEAMGGSVQAMMRAAGYSNEKEFFKAVEDGKVLTKDVLPKFSEELKKMSRAGGALDKTMESTPAQFMRFMNALTETKLAFYGSGMDEGLSYMFKSFSEILEDLAPLTKALGGIFKGVASTIAGGMKLISAPIEIVVQTISKLWSALGIGDHGTTKFWAVAGATGTLVLLATKFKLIRDVIGSVNTGLIAMMLNIARIVAPLLILEDIWVGVNGGKSQFINQDFKNIHTAFKDPQAGWMDKIASSIAPNAYKLATGEQMFTVYIEPKDGEFAKAVDARVEKGNQSKTAATQSEVSQ